MPGRAVEYLSSQCARAGGVAPGARRKATSVLICDSALISAGLRHLLADTWFAVSEVPHGEAQFPDIRIASVPDIFIISTGERSQRMVEAVRSLKDRHPEARFVVIADQFEVPFVRMAREAGVNGFCLSGSSREVLIRSLELVLLGETVLPTAVVTALLDGLAAEPLPGRSSNAVRSGLDHPDLKAGRLSAREAQILHFLMRGAPNKAIARQFDVAEATVKVHVKAILRKIGAVNRTQAAIWATEHLSASGTPAQGMPDPE